MRVQLFQQVHGDHRGLGKVFLENVAVHDAHAVSHPRALCVALGQRGQVFVVLNAPRPRTELPGCRDRDLAVTRTQVHHFVTRADLRRRQHLRDELIAGGQPHHVFAHLSQFGGVGFGRQSAAGLQEQHGHEGPKTSELGHGLNQTGQGYCEVLEGNRISGQAGLSR